MMKKDFSDGFFKTENSSENKQNQTVMNGNLKRSKASILMLFVALFSFAYSFGQTTLISPTGDGGFENGATLAANGWTAVNAATDGWNVGNAPVSATGSNCGYVSANGGAAWTYSQTGTVTHIYKDFTVPAGENKITLSFKWKAGGEGSTTLDWDNMKVFIASNTFTPTTTAVTGQTQISGSGSTSGMYKLSSASWNSETIVFSGTPGTTYRLIFSWKSDGSTIASPPAALDDISLVSAAPGNFISIVTGNWGDASTWDANAVPTVFDNVTVSTSDVVTINATNQTSNNLIVNGTLVYGATPTTFAINGNLTVNTGGLFNVFNGTTGKTVSVSGNITNNGTMDLSVGTTTSGNLTLNGTTVQSVTGSGTFNTGVIRNLIFNNSNVATPNINWSINNVKVAYNLNLTGARINLGTNKMTFGNNAAGNTLTSPSGSGFLPGGKFSRWWTATATGSAITAGSDPTTTASRYPFINAAGFNRAMYITRTNATGAVAGELAVTYNDASTVTSGLSIVDGAYTVTDRYDGNWSVSNEGTAVSASSYSLAIIAQNAYVPANGNSRILGAGAAISGTHQNGTTTPGVQRTLVSQADLLAGPLYIGVASLDIPFVSTASGDWNNAATWIKGTVPSCTDAVIIANGHNVTVSTAGNISKNITINSGGTLTVASGDLTVGCTMNNNVLVNNGTLTVSGGTLNVNGSLSHNATATFNQSAGSIVIDGNDAGIVANSATSYHLNLASAVNWTGGTLTIVDPSASTSATDVLYYTTSSNSDVSPNHTIIFGNGISTDAGGNAIGFKMNTYVGSGRINFGNGIVNGGSGTNRILSAGTYSNVYRGSLVVNANSEYRSTTTIYVAGDITNNGTLTNSSTLALQDYNGTTATFTSNPQTISGSGVFRNSATTVTANLSSLTVNNTNATGVTLSVPLSVSGTLTMTSGLINTTNANLLSLGTATATGTLSGTPSATNMVKGPFARTIANSNSAFIIFPVGKSSYSPISLAPTTTAVSVMKAEAFDSNTGSADASIMNLSSTRRWEATNISGTFTDIQVRLGDALIGATNIPVQAPAAAGIYTSLFGSVATYAVGTPNTIQSNNAVASADFTGFLSFAESNVCSGTPAPGNTIASASTICLGESVVLSVQNATLGTGVTYQWQSSTDGVTYTNISGAVNATLSTSPAASLYYQNVITCATGPTSGSSTPVQINFPSSITASTPATRCGTGTVTLDATPSVGATVSWYGSQIGGTALGTGTTFTTPSIAATTTYYAAPATVSTGNVTIGTGTSLTGSSSQASIFCNFWSDGWKQMVYTAAELSAAGLSAGNITSLTFNTASAAGPATVNNFAIRIGTSATSTLTGFTTTGLALAFGPANYTSVAGLNTITLSIPYNWDGVSNILIDIREDGQYASGNSTTYYTTTATNTVVTANNTSPTLNPSFYTSNPTASQTNTRPNIIFNGQSACSGARVPVVATVTAPPAITFSSASEAICAGQSTPTVTLTAGSTDYDTYTWSPATGVTGDEVSGYVFNPSATTTYTLTATQTAGSLCAITVDFLVNVNALPSALTVTPATAAVCENGIQTLTATGGAIGISGKVGAGTSANTTSTPFKPYWGGSKTQALYTAAELTTMGMLAGEKINSIGYVALTGTPIVMNDFTISAGFVSNTTLGTAFIGGANNTVLAPTAYTAPTGTGNIDFALSTPLTWDGTSNLLIETCFNNNNGGGSSSNSISVESSTVASGLNIYLSDDNEPTLCSNTDVPTTYTSRPNLRISTIESTNITWSPATDLYTDAAATVAYVGGANATTVYAKSATAGSNVYTASATNPSTLCASTATATVTVNAPTTNSTAVTACGTYTWAENGTTYTTSGTYTSVTGCATEELVLTITPGTTNTTTESVCDTYTWAVNGTVYTTSGTYTVVTGCHTEELILTVTPTSTNTTTEVACDTYTWAVNGTVYTTSGTYTVVTGCVTEELILTITPSSTNTTTEVACGTYTWPVNGTVYTASGTYTVVTGCVSEILNLTITPVTTNTTTEVACDTYTWAVNGTTYTTSGTYTSVVGCVTETLNLTVNASPVTTITRTGDDLTADEAGATSYVWGRCDGPFTPIAGATNQSYKPTMVGKYAVRIIKNGCEVTSECVDVTTLDVKALDVANLNLYPNPVTNALTVTYTKNITGVQVYDMTGRLLKNIVTNTNEVSVDMSEMPASIYIVKVIAENTFSEFKVVKN